VRTISDSLALWRFSSLVLRFAKGIIESSVTFSEQAVTNSGGVQIAKEPDTQAGGGHFEICEQARHL